MENKGIGLFNYFMIHILVQTDLFLYYTINYLPYAYVAIPCHGNRILKTYMKKLWKDTKGLSINSWMRKAFMDTTHTVLSTI